MKDLVVVFILGTLVSSTPLTNKEWMSFKEKHGKSYKSAVEEQSRFLVFMNNLKLIEEHNARYKSGLESYYLKMNHMGDMFSEEFNSTLLGLRYVGEREEGQNVNIVLPTNDVPESIDWRDLGAVTPIKNQKHCGSCWAFSATGALEGQLFKKTGKLVSLSEQQLIDCSRDYGNIGCKGGQMDDAFKYVMDARGLQSEESYPYEERDGYCTFRPWRAVSGTEVKSYVTLKPGDLISLKWAVATVGPISVGISAGNKNFRFYGGGIFDGKDCYSFMLDHGVLLVGYGTEGGVDYWIIKNSWGTAWGEKGYMKLERNNKKLCGLGDEAIYPIL